MNNVTALMIFSVAFGVFAYRTGLIVQAMFRYRRHRRIYPALNKQGRKVCSPHNWQSAYLALAGLEPGQHNVCENCLGVAGSDFKLNDPAAEVFRHGLRSKTVQIEANEMKYKLEQECMEKLIGVYQGMMTGKKDHDARTLKMFYLDVCVNVHEINLKVKRDLESKLKQIEKSNG